MPNATDRRVLANVNLTIRAEETVALLGTNGTGKTTLAGIMAGIDNDFDGGVERAAELNLKIPMVFQDYRGSLLPWLSITGNITFPLALHGVGRTERDRLCSALLTRVPARLNLSTPTRRLSGGQSQLVCILRALIVEPKLLICDEPFSALDYRARLSLRALLEQACREFGVSMIFISHSIEDAILLADRVVVLSGAPATITNEITISTPRPRSVDWLESTEALSVRRSLRDLFLVME
jgi:NitT/TauT family transport system ATP-binding protein